MEPWSCCPAFAAFRISVHPQLRELAAAVRSRVGRFISCGCTPWLERTRTSESRSELHERSWEVVPDEHTVSRYTSNWEAWQSWNEAMKGQPCARVVPADALAALPEGITAFRVLLAELFPELGSSQQPARKAVRQGCVLLDGEPVKWDTPLPVAGQMLTLRQLPWYGAQHSPSAPKKLFNRAQAHPDSTERLSPDEKIFIVSEPVAPGLGIYFVHKPSGMESSPWSNCKNLTFEEFLPCVLPCPPPRVASGVARAHSEDISWLPYPKIAHRLDLRVSGVVAVATTFTALRHLKACFEKRTARKTYRAIVAGDLREHSSWLNRVTADEPLLIDAPVGGRAAQTEVFIEHVCPSLPYGALTTVRLHPVTGRQHQLREHLAVLGFPIMGDTEHWNLAADSWMSRRHEQLPSMNPLHGPLLLQSTSLQIPLPGGGTASATIPEAMKFARLRRRSQAHWEVEGDNSISRSEAKARRHDVAEGRL
mmetsp:Transcript_71304/g.201142  ORF Transcript_71304/g.201142 Transcript_71304/m.201142 type:complete len:480 (-) Transcript_71304:42-1481(-)